MPLTESRAGDDSEVLLAAPAPNPKPLAAFLNASVRLSGGPPTGALFSHTLHLDDRFVDLAKTARAHTVTEAIDAAASYALRIIATSPQVTAIQIYSPAGASVTYDLRPELVSP